MSVKNHNKGITYGTSFISDLLFCKQQFEEKIWEWVHKLHGWFLCSGHMIYVVKRSNAMIIWENGTSSILRIKVIYTYIKSFVGYYLYLSRQYIEKIMTTGDLNT